jgi:hypothetical protein
VKVLCSFAAKVFDIHTYGERILENLADATQEEEQPVGFGATVVGCEKYEVCL